MKKGRYAFSLILNVFIIAAIAFATLNVAFGFLPIEGATKTLFDSLTPTDYFFEFGVLAGLFAALVALITVISHIVCMAKNKPTGKFVAVLKMISAGLSLFAVINYFVLDAFVYGIDALGFSGANQSSFISVLLDWHAPLFFSIVAPAIVLFDFLFLELDPKLKLRNSFFALLPAAAYFGFVAVFDYVFVAADKAHFPGVFVFSPFLFSTFEWWKTLAIIAIGVIAIFLFTFLLLGIRNGIRNAMFEEEVSSDEEVEVTEVETTEEESALTEEKTEEKEVAETSEEEPKTEEEHKEEPETVIETKQEEVTSPAVEEAPAATPAPVAPTPKKTGKKVIILKTKGDFDREKNSAILTGTQTQKKSAYKSYPRVYHISKQSNGKWQVKLATGERAIKLFDTQQQAISYAKGLVRTQGGSIRIHAVSGKLRKE